MKKLLILLCLLMPFIVQAQTDSDRVNLLQSATQQQIKIDTNYNRLLRYRTAYQQSIGTITALNTQVISLKSQVSTLLLTNKILNDTIAALRNRLMPRYRGANIHPFINSVYANIPGIVRDVKAVGLNAVRCDLHPNSAGVFPSVATLNNLIQMCKDSGIFFQPMISISPVKNSSAATCLAFGKAVGTAYKFAVYELGNEQDNESILTGDGTAASNYDQKKLAAYAICFKNVADGIRAVNPDAEIIINSAWIHWGFVQYMLANGVRIDGYSQHWYTNQEKAYTGKLPIEIIVPQTFPGLDITFNEVGIRPQTDGSIPVTDYALQTSILKRLSKFSWYYNELYDEPSRGLVEGNFGIYTKAGSPKPLMVNMLKAALTN